MAILLLVLAHPAWSQPAAPELPSGFRARIARIISPAYLEEGQGRAEISALNKSSGLLAANSQLCIRYPANVTFSFLQRRGNPFIPERSNTRFIIINANRTITGSVSYSAIFGPKVDCAAFNGWTAFPELDTAARVRRSASMPSRAEAKASPSPPPRRDGAGKQLSK